MNMKHFYIMYFLFFMCLSVSVGAQTNVEHRSAHKSDTLSDFLKRNLVVTSHETSEGIKTDTTTVVYNQYISNKSILVQPDSVSKYFNFDPRYYRLFVPLTYYYSPIAEYSQVNWHFSPDFVPEMDNSILPYDTLVFTSQRGIDKLVDRALMEVYLKDFDLVKNTEDYINTKKIYFEGKPYTAPRTHVIDLFKPDPVSENVGAPSLKVNRPNWWTYGGSFSVQMTQNYVSDNWYKGGQSTKAFLNYLSLSANYNDKEKIEWDNLFEAKVGASSAPSDTCHSYLVNADLLRLYSKLGIQANKRWYYTITGEFNTQFCNTYGSNSNKMLTSFMAPANFIFTLGMDYKIKTKALDFSLLLSPAAYNLRYVGNNRVDETNFGLAEGDKVLHIVGSKLTSTWTWKMISSITWTSRLYYFTNYKEVEAEWENTFNFALNKYLSTQLFLHGRFDDSVTPTVGSSYFQLKEFLSFGINYAW